MPTEQLNRETGSRLYAVALLCLIISTSIAYAIAGYWAPAFTTSTGGLLGWSTSSAEIFNWRIFLMCHSILMLSVPVIFFIKKKIVEGFIWLGAIGLFTFLLWKISWNYLLSFNSETGWLGFNENVKQQFDAGLLLIWIVTLYGFLTTCFSVVNMFRAGWTTIAFLRILLLVTGFIALACYFKGLHTPIFYSRKFFLWEEEVTLIDSISAFAKGKEIFLAIVVITFTIVFPLIKFMYLFWGVEAPANASNIRVHKFLSSFGKWSMLDVFVIALLILNMKWDSDIIDMQMRSGVVWFSVSIIVQMLASASLIYLHKKFPHSNDVGLT